MLGSLVVWVVDCRSDAPASNPARAILKFYEAVQIRAIATTATNMLECKKGANFSIVCIYF